VTSGSGPGPLCREHFIPLNRQLAAGLEAAIRDGHIRPGAPLPSTRDLARRLELDRSTVSAAYARLRRRRCISGAPGQRTLALGRSGPDPGVRLQDAAPPSAALAGPAVRRALSEAFRLGVSRSAVARAVAQVVSAPGAEEPLLFEPRRGLRLVMAAEIEGRTGVRVRPVGRSAEVVSGSPAFVRREVLAALHARGGSRDDREWLPLDLSGGTRERGLVRRGVRSGVVVLLSVSAEIRRYAAELAAREFARGVSFVALDPEETDAVVRASAVAKLVLFDAASRPIVSPCARTEPVSLLSVRQLEAIQAYLGRSGGRRGT